MTYNMFGRTLNLALSIYLIINNLVNESCKNVAIFHITLWHVLLASVYVHKSWPWSWVTKTETYFSTHEQQMCSDMPRKIEICYILRWSPSPLLDCCFCIGDLKMLPEFDINALHSYYNFIILLYLLGNPCEVQSLRGSSFPVLILRVVISLLNLTNLCCLLQFCPSILINWNGIFFKRYSVVCVRQISSQ